VSQNQLTQDDDDTKGGGIREGFSPPSHSCRNKDGQEQEYLCAGMGFYGRGLGLM